MKLTYRIEVYPGDFIFDTVDKLRQRIFAAAIEIRQDPTVFVRVRDNWIRRTNGCVPLSTLVVIAASP